MFSDRNQENAMTINGHTMKINRNPMNIKRKYNAHQMESDDKQTWKSNVEIKSENQK